MSRVTDILLITAIDDGSTPNHKHSNVDLLNVYLVSEYGIGCRLMQIDQYAGGNKAMQMDVFATSINYCNTAELIEKFKTISWEFIERAQFLIQEEHDVNGFIAYKPR